MERPWADVFVANPDHQTRLEKKALFFIPSALKLCNAHGLNPSNLAAEASAQRRKGNHHVAGKLAIKDVIDCRPVTYVSVLRFINLVNLTLGGKDSLSTSDIVACVFRLRDIDMVAALNLSPAAIAKGCGISEEIVQAALDRYRIAYHEAHAIWSFISKVVKSGSDEVQAAVKLVITDEERTFIITDPHKIHPMAIKLSGVRQPDDDDRPTYVYGRDDLKTAPKQGHYWAIQAPLPPAQG